MGVLVLTGTLSSFLYVSSNPPLPDTKQRTDVLKAKIKELELSKKNPKELASLYWQAENLPGAEKIWSDMWTSFKWEGADYKEFSEIAGNLASTYLDNGHFDEALKTYKLLLDHDVVLFGKTSRQVAKDHNNLAVCNYMKANSTQDPQKRLEFLQYANSEAQLSTRMWDAITSPASKFNIGVNQKLLAIIERDTTTTKGLLKQTN